MDLQTYLTNAVQAERTKELANSPQLLLGEIILKLEQVSNKDLPLFIDIREVRPRSIESWRGRYAELAITTESDGSYQTEEVEQKFDDGDIFYKHKSFGKENPSVAEFIEILKEAQGKTFTGYKGDDFLMSKNTPVWLAEYGESSFKINDKNDYEGVYFIDVREEKDKVYLITKTEKDA